MTSGFRLLLFFSSRRRHTRYIGDWSSDVCSSDLDLVFLGTAKVAGVAAVCGFGGRSFWLMMIEIEVAPAARSGKALGILDSRIGAVETPGEIAPPRRLRARTIGVLARQRELQLLEQDRP